MELQPVRLSELVATMSLMSDLGMGRPMERVLRQTVIAMRLAEFAPVEPEVRAATFYTSLLTWVGCATDTSDLAALFGDETHLYADSHDGDLAGLAMAMFVAKHLAYGRSTATRAVAVGSFALTAGRSVRAEMESHCNAASALAARLDLGESVVVPLLQAFERWDGRGVPGRAAARQLAPAIRLVQLADNVEALHHTGGVEAATTMASARRGTQFDPGLVDVFLAHHDEVLAGLDRFDAWEHVIELDPQLGATLTAPQLDEALLALGDFADLKSPFRLGHSRGVAELVTVAAPEAGISTDDRRTVRLAAAIHDIGTVGVPSGVWDATTTWTIAQRERARTHPYLVERMLARVAALQPVTACAALHHERLDGSGYPRGVSGDALTPGARLLAAADVYHALQEPRPHRDAFGPADAAATLRNEVRAGRLDGTAVDAVLRAAGHRVGRRAVLPAGLTAREREVLILLARGRTNREISSELGISRKTTSSHLEHIFDKLGVRTRTEAALYAMRQGLVDLAEAAGADPAGQEPKIG